MKEFNSVLAAARDTRDPEEYIRRVKSIMKTELLELDPTAHIDDTNYFSHSAIPDFVLRWPRESRERSVFLRDSIDNVVAARDAEFIPDKSPALITLDGHRDDPELTDDLSRQFEHRPEALVTSASTLEVVDDTSADELSPVAELVRANFLRGARGWVSATDARSLITPPRELGDANEPSRRFSEFFSAEATTRIERASFILALAASTASSPHLKDHEAFQGVLSDAELRSILPWVLRKNPEAPSAFWKALGNMFTFSDLERLHVELRGLDLTRLIESNKDSWTARRGYAGLYIAAEDSTPDAQRSDEGMWSFRGTTVGKSLPSAESRVHLAHKGTKLTGRDSTSSIIWPVLESALLAYRLVRVELKGLRRSVTVNAEESDDIRQDISDITSSLEDTYFVRSVTIRTQGIEEDPVDTEVDFGKSLAVANGDSTLASLTKAVNDLLVRYSVGGEEHEVTLHTERPRAGDDPIPVERAHLDEETVTPREVVEREARLNEAEADSDG